jgi:hypothetical protein
MAGSHLALRADDGMQLRKCRDGAPLIGAAIGEDISAIGGTVTGGHDINLGVPIWR